MINSLSWNFFKPYLVKFWYFALKLIVWSHQTRSPLSMLSKGQIGRNARQFDIIPVIEFQHVTTSKQHVDYKKDRKSEKILFKNSYTPFPNVSKYCKDYVLLCSPQKIIQINKIRHKSWHNNVSKILWKFHWNPFFPTWKLHCVPL